MMAIKHVHYINNLNKHAHCNNNLNKHAHYDGNQARPL